MKNKQIISRWCRIVVQILFFIGYPALFAQAFGGVKEAAACLGKGQALEWSSFTVRLLGLCLVTILFGRIFCGWACSFGALGDWIYQLSGAIQSKIGKKLPKIPEKVQRKLQLIKYMLLILIVAVCFLGKNEYVTKYSPWTVFSQWTAGNFRTASYAAGVLLLVLVLLGMAIKERFFCQFLCPMGAVFSLLPELPQTSLHRHSEQCIPNCQLCRKNCPVDLKLDETPMREGECIRCLRCMENCPKQSITCVRHHLPTNK